MSTIVYRSLLKTTSLPKIPRPIRLETCHSSRYMTRAVIPTRAFSYSVITQQGPFGRPNSQPTPQSSSQSEHPTPNLFTTIRQLKGPTRYIIFGSLAILATAETTFWVRVIYAKFFAKEDDDEANEFLERCWEAVRGYRRVWLPNYWRYWGENLWGL
jgi:hypothetical protein